MCTFSKECTRGFTSSGTSGSSTRVMCSTALPFTSVPLGSASWLAGPRAPARRLLLCEPSPPNSGKLRSGPGEGLEQGQLLGPQQRVGVRCEGSRVFCQRQPEARRCPRVERTLARVQHPDAPSERLGAQRHAALGRDRELFLQHTQHHVGHGHGGDRTLVGVRVLGQRHGRAAHRGGHEGHADHVGQLVALGVRCPVHPRRQKDDVVAEGPVALGLAHLERAFTQRARQEPQARHQGLEARLAQQLLLRRQGATALSHRVVEPAEERLVPGHAPLRTPSGRCPGARLRPPGRLSGVPPRCARTRRADPRQRG